MARNNRHLCLQILPILGILSASFVSGAGISPTKLEINLGPMPLDRYMDSTPQGSLIPACSSSWTVRNCIKNMFNNNPGSPPYTANNYVAQGVTGVRFFYALRGGASSSPFDAGGTLNTTWLNNLQQFFTDLRSYGIQRVTPTAVMAGNWSGPLTRRTVTSCGVSKQLDFFPWLPFGLEITNSYPDEQDNNNAYNCAAATPADVWWGWQPMFNLIDAVLARAQTATLIVADFDLENELNMLDFTVVARLIYDNTHTTDVLSTVRQLMWNRGFDGNRVTASVPMFRSNYAGFNCGSVYGDSAALIAQSEITAAVAGSWGKIGMPTGFSWTNNLPCGGASGSMISLPVYHTAATATNIHTHMCVEGDGFGSGFGCNAGIDTTYTAQLFYSDVWAFLFYRGLTGNYVVFGETNSDQNCDGLTKTMAAQNASGYRSSTLYANLAASTALRPWNYIMDASLCYVAPSYINDAYNPFF